MNNTLIRNAESFLKIIKKEISKNNCKLVNRKVSYDGKIVTTEQALLDLGITKKSKVWEYILKLEAKDCINISHDHDLKRDYNDDMYEFITIINKIKVYIKLTINDRGVICLSFHKSRK